MERLPLAGPPTLMQRVAVFGCFGLFAVLIFGHYHLDCRRPAAGEPARCTGASIALIDWSTTLAPFELEKDSVKKGIKLGAGRDERATLVTPGGVLASPSIGWNEADVIAADAERFRTDGRSLEWHRGRTSWPESVVSMIVAALVYAAIAFVRRRSCLVLDLERGLLLKGKRAWAISAIDDAHSSYAGRDRSDLHLVVNGIPELIAQGDTPLIEAAAKRFTKRARHEIAVSD